MARHWGPEGEHELRKILKLRRRGVETCRWQCACGEKGTEETEAKARRQYKHHLKEKGVR